jgi:GNAT superfamily N-acetyltransferase
MRSKPSLRPSPQRDDWRLERYAGDALERYRALFHRVGDEHLWTLRMLLPEPELQQLLADPRLEVYVLVTGDGDEGLLELDFREPGECEIGLFGVAPPLVGTGAGRWLMNRALEIAWSRPIERFWLHTCTLDHPRALEFYRRSGFVPYARKVEVFDDPRTLAITRRDAAAQVPIL